MPYVIQEVGQDTKVQEEIEIASILLIALSRHGDEHPDAIVKVNYPFRVYESEEGNMVFDVLGLSKTEKRWLLPKDISATLSELEVAENSDEILGLLDKSRDLMNREPEYGSTWIQGMIEQDDMKAYLLSSIKANDSEERIKLDLFQPILTKRKFSSMRKSVNLIKKEIEDKILSSEQDQERIENLHEVIKNNQEKKLKEFKKESEKRLENFKKEKEREIKKITKSLKKEIKAINDECNEHLLKKNNEIDLINVEISNLNKKLEYETETDVKRDLANLKKMLRMLNKEIQVLEDERGKRLSKAENNTELEKRQRQEEFLIKRNEEKVLLGKLLETHERTLRSCEELKNRVNSTTITLMKNVESLSKILDYKYKKGRDLYMPFYIFRYGENNFEFYPPIKVSEEKGMRKMLKLFISSNLENKISQYISPQTNVFDGLLEKVINSIKDKTKLSDQFRKALPVANLLDSRETLDKMIVGLYQIMNWSWINERDYIEVQRFLVENLDSLNGGNIFQIKMQEIDESIDTPQATEIAVSE
jgi:DNA repair exonuclease SbcCD ATPase subunit